MLDPDSRFRPLEIRLGANGTEMRVLHVEEARAEIVELLFLIIHHPHFPTLSSPVEVTYSAPINLQKLEELALLADEFDCAKVCEGAFMGLIAQIDKEAVSLPDDINRWIRITKIFGNCLVQYGPLSLLIKYLIIEARFIDNERLVVTSNEAFGPSLRFIRNHLSRIERDFTYISNLDRDLESMTAITIPASAIPSGIPACTQTRRRY